MTKQRPPNQWKPGQTGNPKGRPPGQSEITRLRAAIAEHVPSIIEQLVTAAKGGDMQAARLILERVLPPVKAIEQAVELQLPDGGTLTAKGRAVLSAVAGGELAPSQGAALLGAIGTLARVTEIDEMEARLTKLEEKQNASN
ncbi:MAG: hypothetical protein JJD98_01230 [Polaromonas sp.]|nr:hypothetical protein [Polaromonas sp.]